MQYRKSAVPLALLCLTLGSASGVAQAGVMDFLFGSTPQKADKPTQVAPGRRVWPVGDFTEVRLEAAEPGATANSQPVNLPPETWQALLEPVRTSLPKGGDEPLFGNDELRELVGSLHEAFSVAAPGDDVLLLSSSRRANGFLSNPLALTARLFVQGGMLNLIVHDARQEYFSEYRGAAKMPKFVYGSRNLPSPVALQRPGATSRRNDWLVIPLGVAAAGRNGDATPAVPMPVQPPAAVPMPAVPAVAAPALPQAPGATAPVTPPAGAAPRDSRFFDEQEQRLSTLKRLHDRGLITDDEYQQKRREILQAL